MLHQAKGCRRTRHCENSLKAAKSELTTSLKKNKKQVFGIGHG